MNDTIDRDVDDASHDALVRAGQHLLNRAHEYREAPRPATQSRTAGSASARRLVLVGVGCAVLTTAVLAGSFLGRTSNGGEVEVAEAAWTAVPVEPTPDFVTTFDVCNRTVESMAVGGSTLPSDYLRPVLAEQRGTTALAVYVTAGVPFVCTVRNPSTPDESVTLLPFGDLDPLLSSGASGDRYYEQGHALLNRMMLDDALYDLVVGVTPGRFNDLPDGPGTVVVTRPGEPDTVATRAGTRYVAWMPVTDSNEVTVVSRSFDGAEVAILGPLQAGDRLVDVDENYSRDGTSPTTVCVTSVDQSIGCG